MYMYLQMQTKFEYKIFMTLMAQTFYEVVPPVESVTQRRFGGVAIALIASPVRPGGEHVAATARPIELKAERHSTAQIPRR